MTPVALWTGRLPGLRPLPRARTLWLVGGVVGIGAAGAFGMLGPDGAWLGPLASLAAGWTVWRHRWPSEIPMRLKPPEAPQGPDERAVMVEFRHDGALLGWDVGILWFERGGVGFVGRTVSFVLPRALMQSPPDLPAWQATLRAPQLTAKVFETSVGIVPLARELHAHTTLARIDALPEEIGSETVLPPSSMHPDLIARGLTVRRRGPLIVALVVMNYAVAFLPTQLQDVFPGGYVAPHGLARLTTALLGLCILVYGFFFGAPLPRSARERLPKA